jgi:nucleoside-diphosphate-sugar epimerase
MKVLVTGATGFVGSAVTAELVGRGFDVLTAGGPTSTAAQYQLDVSDAKDVERLVGIGPVDAVVHAAGIAHRFGRSRQDEFERVNVQGVENVAKIAATLRAGHFLLFSSTLVYGRRGSATPITEKDDCHPLDVYGRSKYEGERAARLVCEAANIPLTIFRPAPVIGEGSKGNFARLIRAIDKGSFVWVGNGGNMKSVVYVGDVAAAAAHVLAKGGGGTQTFNIAADAVRMKDIVEAMAGSLGKKSPSLRLPATPAKVAANAAAMFGGKLKRLSAMLDTFLGNDVYSNEKLYAAYGFIPSTTLATAVGREVAYYLKNK